MDYSYKNKGGIFSPHRPFLGCSLVIILLISLCLLTVWSIKLFFEYRPSQAECTLYIPKLKMYVKYQQNFGDSLWRRVSYSYPDKPFISKISFSKDSIFGTDYVTFKQYENGSRFYVYENGFILVTKPKHILNLKSTHFDIARMLSWREYPAKFDFVRHHKIKLKYQKNMDMDLPYRKELFDSTFMRAPKFLIKVKDHGEGIMVYDPSGEKIADKDTR